MGAIKFILGFCLATTFFLACSAADIKFPYKFFHISPIKAWEFPNGELRGDGVRYQLTECKPFRNNEGKLQQKCVVVFYDELNRLIADYKNKTQQLIDCQRGRR